MVSERRKKKAIEEMMARELEKTVGSSGRSHKRHHDDHGKSHSYKRYRRDDDGSFGRSRDYDSYRDDYDSWDRRGGAYGYDKR